VGEFPQQPLAAHLAERLDGQRLAPGTLASYRKIVRLHIAPRLGAVPMDRLTGTAVDSWTRTWRHPAARTARAGCHPALSVTSTPSCGLSLEPLVPPGLGQLSACLRAVAEFLRIDPDLVAVAANSSARLSGDDTFAELPGWLAQLPAESKDSLLLRVARGDGVCAELLAGCRREAAPVETGNGSGRSAADLLAESRRRREDRQREAGQRAQRRAGERRRATELARENHLSELAGRQDQAWREVVELVERRTSADYDAAAGLLHELAEVCRREGRSEAFADRVQQLRREQRRKISFIQRLDRLGMV
jgi:hypothetical protein